jgi:hypothetical protein
MSLANFAFERALDRVAPAFLMAMCLVAAGAVAVIGV